MDKEEISEKLCGILYADTDEDWQKGIDLIHELFLKSEQAASAKAVPSSGLLCGRLLRQFANHHCQDGDIMGAYAHAAFDVLSDAEEFSEEENQKLLDGFLAMKEANR